MMVSFVVELGVVLAIAVAVIAVPLECDSYETLYPGASYTIQSPNYPNNYPKKVHCYHGFYVEQSCEEPQLVCDDFDVRGSPPKCKRADKLKVTAYYENGRMENKKFCGNQPVSFSATGSSWIDFYFKSNRKDQGSGYSCEVSCGGTSPDIPDTTIDYQDTVPPTVEQSVTPDEPTPSPGSCSCGIPNRVNRIVGGVETEANEYPWQVGLIYGSNSNTPSCGGSLISSNTILTAAHCTDGVIAGDISVLVGEHDTTIQDGEFKVNVKEIIQHPDYDPATIDNDYSLLILEDSVEFGNSASPVCLPEEKSVVYENIEAIVTGWGTLSFGGQLSAILQEVDVATMTNNECTSGTQYASSDITGNMLCAAQEDGHGGKDACSGDSGGPLIAKETGGFYSQIGVVSWGAGCGEADAPGVYSRVTEKLQWIKDNMKGSTCGGSTPGDTDTPEAPHTTIDQQDTFAPTEEQNVTPDELTPSPGSCSCGVPNRVNRIVGGVETEANEYPWQVGLIYGSNSNTPSCGGSLISSNTVLTAAHCTDGASAGDISVVVGEHDTTIEDGEFKVNVKEIIQHPDYNSATIDDDYSLLILEDSVEFGNSASPVCLPEEKSVAYENIEAIVTGWGTLSFGFGGQLSATLQEVDVATMTNNECTSGTQYASSDITGNMLCAAQKDGNGGKDACSGDSGGPLIAKETGGFYSQIGVVSWGAGCGEANAPGVYSRVTSKLQWIKDNMKGSTCGGSTPGDTVTTEAPDTTIEQQDTVPPTEEQNVTPDEHTPSPGSCNCGVPNRVNRIIGGVETEVNEYPWQVGLIHSSFGSTPFCGGSLISSNTVLTAAHCTDGASAGDVSVLVGEHDTAIEDGEFKVNVKEIIQHPGYDSITTDNDYSLLILEDSVEWGKSASPVCLPGKTSAAYEDTEAIVSGWGTTSSGQLSSTLQEVDVATMTNNACTSGTQYSSWDITSNMICAEEKDGHGGKDACQGDSGGPLIAKESGESYSQIGVVSWGYGCALADAPGVYSRVTAKLQWIQDNMQGSTCPTL